MSDRVQKILSQWGIASRRQAEQMILSGRVRLNGSVAKLGQRADPATDRIEVDGTEIKSNQCPGSIYLLLNKPAAVVSTCTDPWNRVTVLDLLPPELGDRHGVHPVGRLDADSTGALLLTNDGDLTFYLTHPRHHIPKTYEVWVEGCPREAVLQQWRQGVMLEGQKTLPAEVRVLHSGCDRTQLEIILHEGRNRQIRRVAHQLGHPVIHLHRTAIGSIRLQPADCPPLPGGAYRPLKDDEIGSLKTQIDLLSNRMPAKRSAAHD